MDTLPFDYMAAAGWAKTVEHVKLLAKIPHITHIIIGSYTVEKRDGNIGGTTFVRIDAGNGRYSYVNAIGLLNGGIEYLRAFGKEMVRIAHDAGKKLIVSGAWLKPHDSGVLAEVAFEIGADGYESNDGCPNVFDGGTQKVIPSFDLNVMAEGDHHLFRAVGNKPVWKKVSPLSVPEKRIEMANYLATTPVVRVIAVNTIPNYRPVDEQGRPLITAKNTNGFGGLSGFALSFEGPDNAGHYRELLPPHIEVVGTGGIDCGDMLEEYRKRNCAAMQVGGACFWNDNLKALADIANDWALFQYDMA